MSRHVADHVYLENVSNDQFAALLFELASQLHVERQRRLALETALKHDGLLRADQLEDLGNEPSFVAASRAELDRSLERLLRITTSVNDARGPLRNEFKG